MTRLIGAGKTTFAALAIPNYRRYISGQAISLVGTWMQMAAQSWLVLTLTGSATTLGVVIALQTLPVLLLGPYGGVIADRVDKRRLMVILQAAMGVQALILGVLTVTGAVELWEIGVLALLLGLNNAFENPARQSFMLEMIGPENLRNAVSLNSVLVNVARTIGPAVAGILIATVGERRVLPRERGELRRGDRLADDARPHGAEPDQADAARAGPAARGPALCAENARAGDPAVDDGARRLPRLRVPGLAAGDGQTGPAPRRNRLWLHDLGDGRRRGRRRPARRREGQSRPAPAGGGRRGVRAVPRAGDARAEPRAGARRAGARGRREHRVHVDRQLDPAAGSGAEHARARDEPVVRRLPGLDPDRRPDHRLGDGHRRRPRRARRRGDHLPAGGGPGADRGETRDGTRGIRIVRPAGPLSRDLSAGRRPDPL